MGNVPGAAPAALKVIPGLNCAVLKAKQPQYLFLWYCLRSANTAGAGVLDMESAIDMLESDYGYLRKTAYKHITGGQGVFWRIHHSTRQERSFIILASLAKVAAHFKANISKREHFILVPLSELPPSGKVQARRAMLYNTAAYRPFLQHRNDPISRKSLEEKTGVQARTQRRYDALQEAQGHAVRQRTKQYYRDPETHKLRSFVRVVEKGKSEIETWQLPNRYRTWYFAGSRGMLGKIAAMLNGGDQSSIMGEEISTKGEAVITTKEQQPRRYYSSSQKLHNAVLKGNNTDGVGFYPCRSNPNNYIMEVVLK